MEVTMYNNANKRAGLKKKKDTSMLLNRWTHSRWAHFRHESVYICYDAVVKKKSIKELALQKKQSRTALRKLNSS